MFDYHPDPPVDPVYDPLVFARLHASAVARGGNATGMRGGEERTLSTCTLLALAVTQFVDLAVFANVLDMSDRFDQDPDDDVYATAERCSAAVIRLMTRALEIHARDVGYDHARWLEGAINEAAQGELTPMSLVDRVRLSITALGRALASTENDRMAIPGHIAQVLQRLLRVYALTAKA